MKRFVALFLLLGIVVLGVFSASAQQEFIKSDIPGLLAHQDLLDEIQANLTYMESVAITSLNLDYADLLSRIADITDAQDGQIYETAGRITISGGIHYIDEACDIESITLLNNAVLFNFSGFISSLSIKDESLYFGTSKSQANAIVLDRHGVAYLQDVTGERVTAGGNSEVFYFDAATFPIVYSLEEASMALIGNNVVINRAYVGKMANLIDPNECVAQVEWEEGRGSSTSSGSGKGGKKVSDSIYPPHIVEWVFNSTPQGVAVDKGSVCLCGCKCGNYCDSNNRCCTKCACVYIVHN